MSQFLTLLMFAIAALVASAISPTSAAYDNKDVTPGLSRLPGEIKYENQDSRVKV